MSIKVKGSTIIDDSRNIINATQVGIATTTTSQPFQVGSGTTIVVVNNLGNLGIGTTNPTSKLTVVGNVLVSGVVTATSFSGDGSQLTGIVAGASAISISTNTTNQSQFIPYATSTGSVAGFGVTTGGLVFNPSTTRLGIGTTNARANLDVTDSILISTGVAQTAGFLIKSYTQSNGAISFEDVNNTNPRFSIDRDTSYLFKINDTGFATRLIVNNSGNLGVGTTNPTSKLHIIGDALVSGNLGIGTTNPTSKLHIIGDVLIIGILTATRLFSAVNGEFTNFVSSSIVGSALSISGISTFSNGPVFIGSGTSTGTANQRLQVTGGAYVSGNLGIGTTNARANLDVTDSILISTGVAQTAGFLIKSYTQSNGAISFEDVNNTNPRFSIDRDTSYLFKINDTGFATKLIVNNSGNLGVGTTNPTSKLHIIGDVLITGIVTASNFVGTLTGNATTAGIATNVIGGIGSITQLQVTGISTFSNGPVFIGSGTSTGTANQRLQVTGGAYVSGNLGIGTTNPTSKLTVQGDALVSGNLGIGTTNARANLDVTDSILISTGVAQTAGFLIKSYTQSNGAISFEDVNNTNPRFGIDRDTSYLFKINDTGFATKLIVNNSGNLGVGTTNPTSKLHVIGDASITGISTLGLGNTSTPPNNSQMSFELTSDTNLRIKVRGTDGVLRSGNITLS